MTEKDAVAIAETISAPRTKMAMSSAIVPLMDTESAMLNALNIGADDGKKNANGMVMGMAKEICAYCQYCRFTSVPEWYRGRGGWCKAKGKIVSPLSRKLFCGKFLPYGERKTDGKC